MKINWQNIKGCGYYAIINRLGNERKLNKLLEITLVEYAKKNVRYKKLINEWIFYHNERQNVSAMLPALLSSCEEAFVECPVKRRLKGVDSTLGARIDYWALYDKKTVLLIETKQTFVSARSFKNNSSVYNSWRNLKDQLRSIKKKEIWANLTTEKTKVVYKIGIQMGVLYSHRKIEGNCHVDKNKVEELIHNIYGDKKIDADWIGVWHTLDEVEKDTRQDRYQQYPVCFWAVKAERINC